VPSSSPALSRLAAPSRERPFRSVAAFVVQRSGLDRDAAAAHGANIEPPTRSHIPETAQRGGPCITVVLLPSPQRSAYLLRRRLQLTNPRLCFHALSNNCVDDDHPRRLNPRRLILLLLFLLVVGSYFSLPTNWRRFAGSLLFSYPTNWRRFAVRRGDFTSSGVTRCLAWSRKPGTQTRQTSE